jgi:integrase
MVRAIDDQEFHGRSGPLEAHPESAVSENPKMRLHDLRHSAVAIRLAQRVNIKAISELLGHSREIADKMDAALSPIA